MASSVAGTVPDQTWGQALPGYFKDNIQPQIYESAYLIQRPNIAVPDVVSENTVGMAYDRGFIDKPVPRMATIRRFIENPSTYITRLHPHDLTSGTGGIDNLSNLYRFGQPLPVANAGDFLDIEYWASRELKREANDPLSNGYAKKVLGPSGIQLQSQMLSDAELADKKRLYIKNKTALEAARLSERTRLDGDAPEPEDVQNRAARAENANNRANRAIGNEIPIDEENDVNTTAAVDESINQAEEEGLASTATRIAEIRRLQGIDNAAEAETGYNTNSTLGQYAAMQHNLTYAAIARNQLHVIRGPASTTFSNTLIPTAFNQRNTAYRDSVSGSSVSRDQSTINEQLTDPRLRQFRGGNAGSVNILNTPVTSVNATQIQNLQRLTRNNEEFDGDNYSPQDRVQLANHPESVNRPPTTPITVRTGNAVSASLRNSITPLSESQNLAMSLASIYRESRNSGESPPGTVRRPRHTSRTVGTRERQVEREERAMAQAENRNIAVLRGAIQSGHVTTRRGYRS